ncbi:hypothetical protein HFO99_21490 [Rhizobium leguminosarum]|uniref:hypothetical protein n=1 Tax=Rhizobium leguminosarum TaxID=384 RepID=UPI001C9816FE|nr:hypothetical protein [Rhizobium leguminosarum]MBY5336463.1 hypothetical protein [Rhizobium leguminosarum]
MGEASRDSRATGIPAWNYAPERPQLGAYAQAAVISFKTAFFAIALLFVAAVPIPSAYKINLSRMDANHELQEQRFVISSGACGSGTFSFGATVPSEDVGERIEHRRGRGGLK